MKKRFVTMIMAMMLAATPMMAQVFYMEDGENTTRISAEGDAVFNVIIPTQDSNTEVFLPLGNGVAALVGLGAAYLIGKRRKHRRDVS